MNKIILHIAVLLFVVLLQIELNAQTENIGKKRNVNIVYIGNSITEATYLETSPPQVAAEYLMDEGYLVKYSNCGMSGYTTVNFLPPGGTFNKVTKAADAFYKDKNALLVFSIKLGTNDSANNGTTGAPVSPETYKKNIKTIADSLHYRYPTCKIVLNYPTWYSPNTHNSAEYLQEGLDRLQSYFPKIKELAEENPDYIYEGDKDAFSFFEQNYLEYHTPQNGNSGVFYLHPNQKGAIKLGEFWAKALQKLLISWGYDLDAGRKKVLCIGNSITNNALLENQDRYPTILQSILGEGYNVKNYGIGIRTLLTNGDYPYINEDRYNIGLQWKPDIVIIKLGTNDLKDNNWQYKSNFVNDYKNFIAPFKNLDNNPIIYICYPTPLFINNIIGVNDSRLTNEMIPMINLVSQETGAIVIDLHSPLVNENYCTYDNLHPNKKGTNIMARKVAQAICPECEIPALAPSLLIQAENVDFLGKNNNANGSMRVGIASSNKDSNDTQGGVILNTWNNHFAVYKNIDFETEGYNTISVRKNIPRGSRIEVWLDRTIDEVDGTATNGSLIGTIEVPSQISTSQTGNTATPSVWKTLEQSLNTTLNGVHDICMVFRSGSNSQTSEDLGMLNWFEFTKNTTLPESISIVTDKVKLQKLKSYKIIPSVLPVSASNALKWEVVEGQDMIDLNIDGEVIGLKKGKAVVKVMSVDRPELNKLMEVVVEENQLQSEMFRIEAESFDYALDNYHWGGNSNIIRDGDMYDGVGKGLIYIWHDNIAQYKNIDFAYGGTKEIKIRRNFPRESFIEVWIDRTIDKSTTPATISGGEYIKSLFVEGKDGWGVTKTLNFEMPEITGIHDLYLQFYSAGETRPEQQHGHLDWFEFNRDRIKENNSLTEEKQSTNSIYPNPVYKTLNIISDEDIKTINIVNVTGKQIYTESNIGKSQMTVDASSFLSGVYLVNIETETQKQIMKFIKN